MRTAFAILLLLVAGSARAADAPFQTHYVSQRADKAFLREGPGYRYKVLWVYRHKGYPFRESASFDIWRRVTAADGAVGWMSEEMLSERRTVLVTGESRAPIHERGAPNARVIGLADPDAVMGLKSCGPDFCRVSAEGLDGWISRDRIWGVDANEFLK